MESKLSNLHIDMPPRAKIETPTSKKKPQAVVDSWEDEDTNSPQDEGSNAQTPTDTSDSSFNPAKRVNSALAPPPPTPISPEHNGQSIDWSTARVLGGGRPTPYSASNPSSTPSDSDRERRRPEKSTATASRLIAAGLGMKAPKKTEETRQYERAVREQEIKRKNREKEAQEREKEADEKLKAAVWDS
ncbi:uncharacterized protein A1O9_11251 [Exophiala aquamarina CBS 119918]|uniref:Uncharacterized protein n=1 Tax=Exophiala aquamarina CBS 119918 TaxID=1182545 RepID=A0A072NYA1_9EURO|nr:uncharacterized protein A1O9_11251 [Exophiala aquamarina CBS 119918]KEF52834.1 hypothetical protein A1O9_11251 [Exophiala aquamarina CBS 119918]